MRILIPAYTFPDSFAENVAYTLRFMGHEVRSLAPRNYGDVRARVSSVRNTVLGRVMRDYVPDVEREALRVARDFRPELVLALTQQLASETLRDFGRLGVKWRVAWWGDAPANMKQMGLLDDGWDAIFLKDPDCVRKFARVGFPAFLLHEAHNPAWHRPLASANNETVVVVGNFYAYRQVLVRRLIDHQVPVSLYGGPLPRWVDPEIARLHTRIVLLREEKSRAFGEGLACLNSMHVVEGNSLNCRAFEIAGAAGLQLIEQRPIIEACFEPGREVWTFDGLDQLLEHLERATRFPAEAAATRRAGHDRAVREHTYRHRLEHLFATLSIL